MWDSFIRWLPEIRPGTLEIRDIVGLAVAALALILSVYAIRMGKRQEAIALEQAAITKRQGEIAEVQHQVLQEQLAKRSELRVVFRGKAFIQDADPPNKGEGARSVLVEIAARNTGTKTVGGYRWELMITPLVPMGVKRSRVAFVDTWMTEIDTSRQFISPNGERYAILDGYKEGEFFPGLSERLTGLMMSGPHFPEFLLSTRIWWEDKVYPPNACEVHHFVWSEDRRDYDVKIMETKSVLATVEN